MMYLNFNPLADPFAVVTVSGTSEAVELGGVVATISASDVTESFGAGVVPNFTTFVPVRPVPVIVTASPPDTDPWAGSIAMSVGAVAGVVDDVSTTLASRLII